jgi:hypothetical protein
MLNQLSNLELWLILGLTFLIPTTITLIITIVVFNKKLNRLDDYMVMSLTKYDRLSNFIDESEHKKSEHQLQVDECMNFIADTVDSLSSSNEMILRNIQGNRQSHGRKIYPRPQLANEIAATIREQIGTELIKSKNLRAPSSNYLHTIIENVSRTYPDIDIDYIANKCIAMLETMGSGNGG